MDAAYTAQDFPLKLSLVIPARHRGHNSVWQGADQFEVLTGPSGGIVHCYGGGFDFRDALRGRGWRTVLAFGRIDGDARQWHYIAPESDATCARLLTLMTASDVSFRAKYGDFTHISPSGAILGRF